MISMISYAMSELSKQINYFFTDLFLLQPSNDISHIFDVCHKRYSDETGIQSQQYV